MPDAILLEIALLMLLLLFSGAVLLWTFVSVEKVQLHHTDRALWAYCKALGVKGWTLLILDVAGLIPASMHFPWWGLLLVCLFGVLVPPFIAFQKLKKRVDELESKLEPKLRIVESPKVHVFYQDPTEKSDRFGGSRVVDVYRVGIVNDSGKTIKNVKAVLEEVIPNEGVQANMPLRFSLDTSDGFADSRKGFDIAPGATAVVDVVRREVLTNGHQLHISFATSETESVLYCGLLHAMVVTAYGDDIPPVRQQIHVWKDSHGALVFDLPRY